MSGFVLTRLHREHTRFRELLHLLARQLDGLKAGPEPDIAAMVYTLDRLTGAAQHQHARSEDQLLDRLTARAPQYIALATELRDQRQDTIACGEQVRTMVEAARDGHVARRDQFARAGRRFVSQFESLVHREENEVFPRLIDSLLPSDWVEVTTQCNSHSGMPAGPRDDDGYMIVTGNLVCPRSRVTSGGPQWSGSRYRAAETRRREP